MTSLSVRSILPHADAVSMPSRWDIIHCFEVVEESVAERAEPEFRDRIEIGERLYAAKKNCAELGALLQSACQIAPLRSENIDSRLKAFIRLFSDLDREINK